MTTGTMITASATLPAKALNCLNGSTRNVNTKIPIRIDGMPTSTSAANRMSAADRRSPNSRDVDRREDAERNGDDRGQSDQLEGAEDRGDAPPPTPAAFGAFVSRSMLIAPMPLTTTKPMTATSGMTATIRPRRARPEESIDDRPPLIGSRLDQRRR